MFSAPIPGQSLTSEPKNSPWENPPQMNKPEEAVLWHLKKLDKPKSVKSVVGLLGLGLDLVTLTEGLLRGAVAEGRHSIDVSLLIAPVIHEYIKGIADASGVEYNEELRGELMQQVRNVIGPIATPDKIHWAPALPKTRSGKIMRRILRKIATNETDQIGDVSTLADPSVVEHLIANK